MSSIVFKSFGILRRDLKKYKLVFSYDNNAYYEEI